MPFTIRIKELKAKAYGNPSRFQTTLANAELSETVVFFFNIKTLLVIITARENTPIVTEIQSTPRIPSIPIVINGNIADSNFDALSTTTSLNNDSNLSLSIKYAMFQLINILIFPVYEGHFAKITFLLHSQIRNNRFSQND